MSRLLGQEAVTLRRTAQGLARGADGRVAPGTATDYTVMASVFPASDDQLETLTEAERKREPRMIRTKLRSAAGAVVLTELRTTDQYTAAYADRFVIDSKVYEVRTVGQERTVMPHWRALLLRVQEGTS